MDENFLNNLPNNSVNPQPFKITLFILKTRQESCDFSERKKKQVMNKRLSIRITVEFSTITVKSKRHLGKHLQN
jgi:hypothetical protein